MTTTTISKAQIAYNEAQANVAAEIERLQAGLAQHKDNARGRVNYAHVGDLEHVELLLRQINAFVYNEED